jgi:hypothetical protein
VDSERDNAAEVDAPVHVRMAGVDVVQLVSPGHQVIQRQPAGPVEHVDAVDIGISPALIA